MTAKDVIHRRLASCFLQYGGVGTVADQILEDLREAGWHLLSTPTFTEHDEREPWDSLHRKPTKVVELAAILDGEVFHSTERLSGVVIESTRFDVVPHVKRSLGLRFVRTLGHRLGVPGCEVV